jgi:uncharacterized protein
MPVPHPTLPQPPSRLALFPLQTVLFPGGVMRLKVFEARYLDLMSRCLRERSCFGIVGLLAGAEVQRQGEIGAEHLVATGVAVGLDDVDMSQPGLMHVQLSALQRFTIADAVRGDGGLWTCEATAVADDPQAAPADDHASCVEGLHTLWPQLREHGASLPAQQHFDDAGWVAKRWSELLPIPVDAKHALLVVEDPLQRLSLVTRFLREQGVIR